MAKGVVFKTRLEYVGPNPHNASLKSSKFWECLVKIKRSTYPGSHVDHHEHVFLVRRWGKIGTYGTYKHDLKHSKKAAVEAALKFAGKKRAKGYTVEVEADAVSLLAVLAEAD